MRTESTCEAEYLSKETRYIVKLLDFLDVKCKVFKLMCDNRAAVNIAIRRDSIKRKKHIKAKCLIVQDLTQEKEVKLENVPGSREIADLLTQLLPRSKFGQWREALHSGERVGSHGTQS